jgi:hypothetical protein
LSSLESRLSLPPATADQIYASRDTYAAQSQQIASNADLNAQQRKDQLAAIATQAQADLVAKLGQDGADAYSAKASWLQMLKNGNAFTTNASDAPLGQYGGGTTVARYRTPTAGK